MYIPLPGIDPEALAEIFRQNAGGIIGMFDMFSGGALGRMSIFALNIMPYISAAIIMQLMTAVSPNLEALKKEIGRAHVELQSLMRISYAVFCLKKKNTAKVQYTY